MSEIIEQAKQKLAEEEKNFKGDQYGMVVYKDLAATLKNFCSDERFAKAIVESGKTLSDCCKTILSDVRGGISDIETYKRAAEFYFPKATVWYRLEICLDGQVGCENEGGRKIISLLDVM